MGIKHLFKFGQARDQPKDTLGSGYSFLFGRTTSGKPVNENTAMQTSAVYACVRILAESLTSLPIHIYAYKENGGKEMVVDHPLYKILHDEPNIEMTSFVFRETLMYNILHFCLPKSLRFILPLTIATFFCFIDRIDDT